jgi:glyoxylase-like metal-dependent hydrolase (beta-lactamase superfamily II)
MVTIPNVLKTILLAVVLACVACGGSPAAAPPVTRADDVGVFQSIPWGFDTMSYWIEGPEGLVAIDTQFLPSAAEKMIATAEAKTKKKFVLAIVLHANPDKFNGTAVFQRHGVKVITSEQVKKVMPEVHEKRVRAFYDRYQPDYPKELPSPDVFGDKTTDMTVAGGVKLRLHVMGAGCSEAHVVVERPDTHDVFVGDLVANQNHSWLEIGKTDEWLKRIDELKKLAPSRVFPGRGQPGRASLLDDEETYLKKVIAIVAAEKPTLPRNEAAFERAKKSIVDAYPSYGYPVFLEIGLPAEWERQAKQAK